MRSGFFRGGVCAVIVSSYVLLSQHMGSDGSLWWRQETKPLSRDECRAALKKVTTRPRVGFAKWYDVSPQQLFQEFGHAATSDRGTWLACWPEGTDLSEPDS